MTSLLKISDPLQEPLLLAEVREYLRVDNVDQDALLASLIRSTRVCAETYTGRAFITQSWRLFIDVWPSSGTLCLPKPPLVSVEDIFLLAPDDTSVPVSPSTYTIDTSATLGKITLQGSASLMPGKTRAGIRIDFTAGYGDTWNDIPEPLRLGMLQHIAHLYENRGATGARVPASSISFWQPYRLVRI